MTPENDNTNLDIMASIEELVLVLTTCATGGSGDDARYRALRKRMLEYPGLLTETPSFVRTCRSLSDFWSFIKPKVSTYAERREFLRSQFALAFEVLERSHRSPIPLEIPTRGDLITWRSVQECWGRALERRDRDPEAAITAARSLLESVCKCILDEASVTYDDHSDLPRLYSLAAKQLNLAPQDHPEQVFKQILGGCQTVVEGLGAMRNRLGDAHGKGTRPVRPGKRHAELAVNLAGSMASFLIATWEFRRLTSPECGPVSS